jgi:hypothetical protein
MSGFLFERAGASLTFWASAAISLLGGAVFIGYSLLDRKK